MNPTRDPFEPKNVIGAGLKRQLEYACDIFVEHHNKEVHEEANEFLKIIVEGAAYFQLNGTPIEDMSLSDFRLLRWGIETRVGSNKIKAGRAMSWLIVLLDILNNVKAIKLDIKPIIDVLQD